MARTWCAFAVLWLFATAAGADPARVEPFTVDLAGWAATVQEQGAHRHVTLTHAGTRCTIASDRWWGLPDTPGPPLV